MNRCSLCMTELHPEAVVCVGCGATKLQVRKKAGFFRGVALLGLCLMGLLLLMGGRFLMGFGFIAAGAALVVMLPFETKWVRSI